MIELRVELDRAAADRAIGQLGRKAQNIAGGLKNVGEALLQVTRDRFSSQTDPEGRAWLPLRPLTVATRGGSASPILTRSGRLKGSISYQVGGSTLRLGPNTIYDAVQQFGALILPVKAKKLRVPLPGGGAVSLEAALILPRPYIGFGPKDEEAAREAVEEWLEVDGT